MLFNRSIHFYCFGIQAANFHKFSKSYKKTWKCEDCKLVKIVKNNVNWTQELEDDRELGECEQIIMTSHNYSKNVDRTPDNLTFTPTSPLSITTKNSEVILQEVKLIHFELSNIKETNKEIQKSIEFLANKFDKMEERINILERNYVTVIETMTELKEENKSTKIELNSLKEKFCMLEQDLNNSSLEIVGVPTLQNENLTEIAYKIFSFIDDNFNQSGLLNVYRIKSTNNERNEFKTKSQPIIVKCANSVVKQKIINNIKKKKIKITTNACHIINEEYRIYINEHLTPYYRNIFYKTRMLKKQGKILNTWTNNGNVYLKKDTSSPTIRIPTLDSLEKIFRND
ncbi:uncharacterized protein LOC111627134 [Centruroides sculpturatus]|uniref:uncharacterized protein LOC111627134 n=1 Tax=Centruroides sculpturatus TaxID=218467 RepID=UPI000C6ED64A|nr:uncharacterized protein LOC111627134 [Centruroides sculpturatus]